MKYNGKPIEIVTENNPRQYLQLGSIRRPVQMISDILFDLDPDSTAVDSELPLEDDELRFILDDMRVINSDCHNRCHAAERYDEFRTYFMNLVDKQEEDYFCSKSYH